MNLPKLVEEKDFFSLSSEDRLVIPSSPYIYVQFRTDVYADEGRIIPIWETVSSRYVENGDGNYYESLREHDLISDNFFDSLSIEDNGGMVNCDLSLFDRGFSKLERMIMRMIYANKKEKRLQKKLEESDNESQEYYVGFKATATGVNFRLRIGYSDQGSDYIDDPHLYDERTLEENSNKIVLGSRWLYFQILDCAFDVSESGLYAKIKAYSISNSILGKMKLLQRFAILKGTPELILDNIGKELFISTNQKVMIMDENGRPYAPEGSEVDYLEDDGMKSELGVSWEVMSPDEYDSYLSEEIDVDDGDGGVVKQQRFTSEQQQEQRDEKTNMYRIEITLGGEPVQERDPETNRLRFDTDNNPLYQEDYKSIKALLREICNETPPKFYNSDSREIIENPDFIRKIIETDDDFIELGSEMVERKKLRPLNYSYSVVEQSAGEDDNRILKIRFHYQKVDTDQGFIRKYSWRNNLQSLVNSFSVSSKLDFAQMNTNVVLDNEVISIESEDNDESEADNNASASSKYRIPLDGEREFAIVSGKVLNGYGDTQGNLTSEQKAENYIMVNTLRSHLRENYFTGNISIPGDPFYFFDAYVQPYQYMIKIEVLNDFNPHEQSYGDALKESYLSGFYYIKSIKHDIDSSGFNTVLNVERFPGMTPSESIDEEDE